MVDTKKFFYCYGSVLDWDDNAAEEAFHNAKKRFWEEINGLHSDLSLPDPDIYIDEIDWDAVVDPQLIKELDREYVPPDESSNNVEDHGNSWECQYMQVGGAFQSTSSWNQRDNIIDNSNLLDNARVSVDTRGNEHLEGNGWGDSWGWNSMRSNVNQSSDWNKDANAWNGGYHNLVSTNDHEWNDSWNQYSGLNQQEFKNTETANNLWGHSNFGEDNRAPKERGGRDGGDAGYWRPRDHYNNQKKNSNFRSSGGKGSRNEVFQNKKGFHHASGYKNSRFQNDENQTGHYCWRVNNKQRPG